MAELLERLGIHSREGVEAFIERLIETLDAFDGDADMEPELGWSRIAGGVSDGDRPEDDREGDDERERDDGESGIADMAGMQEQVGESAGHYGVL